MFLAVNENDESSDFEIKLLRFSPSSDHAPSFSFPCRMSKEDVQNWNKEKLEAPPLTVRIAKERFTWSKDVCPGCIVIGKKGLWWKSLMMAGNLRGCCELALLPSYKRTQAVASFEHHTNNTILVKVALAIDSPILAP